MPIGLRLGSSSVDLDGFLAFVRAQGAVDLPPNEASGEIIRFAIERAGELKTRRQLGTVSKRKDGRLTFAGVARELYSRMIEQMRTQIE